MRRWNFTYCCVTLLFLLSSVAVGAEPGSLEYNEVLNPNPGQAPPTDTIRLKNGSILHGLVVRFEGGFFTIVIPGTQSRAMVHVNDVERIDFVGAGSASTSQTGPATPPPVKREEVNPSPSSLAKNTTPVPREGTKPSLSSPSKQETAPSAVQREEIKSPPPSLPKQETTQSPRKQVLPPPTQVTEKSRTTPTPSIPPETKPTSSDEKPTPTPIAEKKPSAGVPTFRERTVSVSGREVWADSGLDVVRGERLRFSVSGRVNLSRNQSAGPEGVAISDPQKMMPNRPTGGLIAVIGDDNNDFIFIGAAAEFIAQRSGRLFLMVNENNLDDNAGAFTVRIQVEGPSEP